MCTAINLPKNTKYVSNLLNLMCPLFYDKFMLLKIGTIPENFNAKHLPSAG